MHERTYRGKHRGPRHYYPYDRYRGGGRRWARRPDGSWGWIAGGALLGGLLGSAYPHYVPPPPPPRYYYPGPYGHWSRRAYGVYGKASQSSLGTSAAASGGAMPTADHATRAMRARLAALSSDYTLLGRARMPARRAGEGMHPAGRASRHVVATIDRAALLGPAHAPALLALPTPASHRAPIARASVTMYLVGQRSAQAILPAHLAVRVPPEALTRESGLRSFKRGLATLYADMTARVGASAAEPTITVLVGRSPYDCDHEPLTFARVAALCSSGGDLPRGAVAPLIVLDARALAVLQAQSKMPLGITLESEARVDAPPSATPEEMAALGFFPLGTGDDCGMVAHEDMLAAGWTPIGDESDCDEAAAMAAAGWKRIGGESDCDEEAAMSAAGLSRTNERTKSCSATSSEDDCYSSDDDEDCPPSGVRYRVRDTHAARQWPDMARSLTAEVARLRASDAIPPPSKDGKVVVLLMPACANSTAKPQVDCLPRATYAKYLSGGRRAVSLALRVGNGAPDASLMLGGEYTANEVALSTDAPAGGNLLVLSDGNTDAACECAGCA